MNGTKSTMKAYYTIFLYSCSQKLQEKSSETAKAASSAKNIFDDLPALKPPETTVLENELERYLSTPQYLSSKDGLRWWYDPKNLYPLLLAMDYLSISSEFFLCFWGTAYWYTISKPHQSMSNEFSARVGFSSHMYIVGYQFNQHAPFCVLEHGVY